MIVLTIFSSQSGFCGMFPFWLLLKVLLTHLQKLIAWSSGLQWLAVNFQRQNRWPSHQPQAAPAAWFFCFSAKLIFCQLTVWHLALASTAKHFSDFILHFSLKAQKKKKKTRIFLETQNLGCWPFFCITLTSMYLLSRQMLAGFILILYGKLHK